MTYLPGVVSGATADALGQAQAVVSTDRMLAVQPSNSAAPNTLVQVSPDQVAVYAGVNAPYVPTISAAVSPTAVVLDHVNHGRTLVAVGNTIVQAPSAVVNLGGSNSGDGYWMRLLNPQGYTITFAANGGNTIVVPSGLASSSLAGVYEFYASTIAGTTRIVAALPTLGTTAPTLTFASISSTAPAAAATVVYNFTGGAPGAFSAALAGSAITPTSGPTIATVSGSGATAAGTVTFGMTNPAAGTYALTAATTGTYPATAPSYSLVVSAVPALTFASVSSATVGATATLVYNFVNGLPAGAGLLLDGSAATVASGPAIATTSGSGATAAGTVTWTLTVPAAATHALVASTTGTYAATASSYSWVTSAGSPMAVTAVAPQAIGVANQAMVFNVTYTGTWAVPTVLVDGSAATVTANSAGSGGVGTVTITAPAVLGNTTSTTLVNNGGQHTISATGATGSTRTSKFFAQATGSIIYDFWFGNGPFAATSTDPAAPAGGLYIFSSGTGVYNANAFAPTSPTPSGLRAVIGDGTSTGMQMGWSKSRVIPPTGPADSVLGSNHNLSQMPPRGDGYYQNGPYVNRGVSGDPSGTVYYLWVMTADGYAIVSPTGCAIS